MKRTWIVLTIAVLAVMLVATPGLAAGPRGQGGMGPKHGQGTTVFALVGYIEALDSVAKTIEVDVVKSKKGAEVPVMPIHTNSSTRFIEWTEEIGVVIKVTIEFSDLEVGDPVSINGVIEGDEPLATRVTVNPYCPALQ